MNVCTDAALILLDIYSEHVGGSQELESMIHLLHRRIRTEVEVCQQACQIKGMMDMLMAGMP